MEISLLGLIGIGLATMFFGYFFGLFEGRGQGYKRRQKEEHGDQPPKPAPAAQVTPDQHNAMELSQDVHGKPLLRIDGLQVDASDMAVQQRRRLIDLMVMLRPWVEPAAAAQPTDDSTSAENPPPASSRVRVGGNSTAHREEAVVEGSKPESFTEPPVAAPASMSLVAQIDSILQARLAGTALANRGIRLSESLHGGAIVFIGSAQYDGVEKVPDPEIQTAIRAAISDWEKKYTPS